jgi:hypothetical protein
MATKDVLSVDQVDAVLKFAEGLYKGYYNTVYTPYLVNSILQNKTLNPVDGTTTDIETAMKSPKSNEQNLIGYTEYQELTNMVFKRSINYYANLLAYNVGIECVNAKTKDDYTNNQYRSDEKKVREFLDKFDVRKQFGIITKQLFRQEAYFGSLWNVGNRMFFQELPQKYCLITGEWENGLLFDFNMQYFLQPGTDINGYLDEYKEYFNRMMNSKNGYNPTQNVYDRDGSWVFWVQTNPLNNWCFKFSPNVATRVPYLSSMLLDASLQPLMRELQKNVNIIAASKILTGEIEMKKEGKGGIPTNNFTIDPKTLGEFLSVVKSGLNDLIQIAALPLNNVKGVEYDTKDAVDLYSNYNRSAASMAGNSRILYSYERANAVESRLAMNVDENVVRQLYSQYETFLNYMINILTTTYKFKVTLSGFNDYTDRKDRFEATKYWAEKGVIDIDGIAHSLGYNNRYSLLRRMEEVQAVKFQDLITMLPNMYTQASGSGGKDGTNTENGTRNVIHTGQRGRPRKEIGSVSDNGTELNPESNANKQ